MNSLIEMMKDAVSRGDEDEIMRCFIRLSERVGELDNLRTPQAQSEKDEISEYLNSSAQIPDELMAALGPADEENESQPETPNPSDPTALLEQAGPFSPTLGHVGAKPEEEYHSNNGGGDTQTVLLQKPKLPLSAIPRDPEQPKQNWSPEIPYPIIMVNCEKGLISSWPKFTEMASYIIRGKRGGGKSSLEECIGLRYWSAGGNIWDIFSSHLEALAWIDAPEEIREAVRFVVPKSTGLTSPFDIKTILLEDALDIADGSVKEAKKIFVVCKRFYGSSALYFDALKRLSDAFSLKDYWDAIDVVLVRESGNWLSARMKAGKNSQQAQADFIAWHSELLHSGYAALLDALRLVSISKEIRDVTSGTILKAQGSQVLERERRFLYRMFTADLICNLPLQNFVLHLADDAVFTGWYLFPYFHEIRGKNILKRMDIDIKFDKKLLREEETKANRSEDDSRRVITTDIHERIVRMKIKGTSTRTIAAALGISENTIKSVMTKHRVGNNDDCSIEELKGSLHVDTENETGYMGDEEVVQ